MQMVLVGIAYDRPATDEIVQAAQAEALSIPERILLFCVASRTEWGRAESPVRPYPPW
jgi:hypothetical protein